MDVPYFNAGVLLLGLDRLRSDDIVGQCLALGDEFGSNLPSADQTILNLLFGHTFRAIPTKFNISINPNSQPVSRLDVQGKISHFIGYPKPCDLMGEAFN